MIVTTSAMAQTPAARTVLRVTGSGGQQTVLSVPPGGLQLGIEPDVTYEEYSSEDFPPGTLLVAATDGLFEAQNPQGDMFGRERIQQVVREASGAGASAQSIVDTLDAALTTFVAGARVKDDVTFVVIRALVS